MAMVRSGQLLAMDFIWRWRLRCDFRSGCCRCEGYGPNADVDGESSAVGDYYNIICCEP
nr:hypothetical protein Itr_chr03CG12080 [Ipomoea trifida]